MLKYFQSKFELFLYVKKDGYTPFHRACWGKDFRHSETVRAFIQGGIDPDLPAKNGATCEKMTSNAGTKLILSDHKKKLEREKEEL